LNLLELDNQRASLLQLLDDVSPPKLRGVMEAFVISGDQDSPTALISNLSDTLEARLAITRSSKDWEDYARVDRINRSPVSPLSALQQVVANNETETNGKGSGMAKGKGNGNGNGKKKEVKKGKSSGKGRR
jgi:hypothetical protein